MNGDFDFFEPALASEDGATPVSAPNPYWQGHRVVDRDDLFPKGLMPPMQASPMTFTTLVSCSNRLPWTNWTTTIPAGMRSRKAMFLRL